MSLFDFWRKAKPTRERRVARYRTLPPDVGQCIACTHVMLRVSAPVGLSLWEDLLQLGWRTVDPRSDRRHYALLNPEFFDDLLMCDRDQLLDTHRALLLQKPHPLGLEQAVPTRTFHGLPGVMHWQGGRPRADAIQLNDDEMPI